LSIRFLDNFFVKHWLVETCLFVKTMKSRTRWFSSNAELGSSM